MSTHSNAIPDPLWLHFTPNDERTATPIIVRGEGAYIWDSEGKRYLDGLSGLFAVQVGHGRTELAEAAARQMRTLGYFPLWGYRHPTAIELAQRLTDTAPDGFGQVFFTVSGGESVETAWKLARNYWKRTGKPGKHKVVSRHMAYHGTTLGALSITGIPAARTDFEPLLTTTRVPNTNSYRATTHGDDPEAFGRWAADRVEEAIEFEGPDTVAAVFVEPLQNTGGCFVPPPGYFPRLREICDRHDVLLVSDEVICAFGRLGYGFGAQRYGYTPDLITTAKGLTSGYAPLGAVLISDRVADGFAGATFLHGSTYGGHPVSCAVALANLDLLENEQLYARVRQHEHAFRSILEELLELPVVGDVRGAGYFYAVEIVKDKATKASFTEEESQRILHDHISTELLESGLHCRADDRAEPVVQLAPPLICDRSHFVEIAQILRSTLADVPALL